MNKHFKKVVFIILAIGALFIIATVSINSILKNKLEKFIQERLPENIASAYDDITVETFGGSLTVSNASVVISNTQDKVKHTFINVEKLKISDISYWNYLVNDEIHIENISLENPRILYYQDLQTPSKDSTRNPVARIYKPISVDRVQIKNTRLAIYEKGKDSTKIYATGLTVELNDILVDNKTVLRKIPFNYKNVEATSDTVFVKVGKYENLTVEEFSIKNNNAIFKNLNLKTKYSKRELSRIITKERDHYDLSVKSLSIADFDFGFKQNRFFAKSRMISVNTPSLEIYRDKLVADDPKIKPLYSKMLRDLPFELTVDSLTITDAKIRYEERQKPENMGGSINFENLNAAISNVSNTYKSPTKTDIKVSANFMNDTPLTADWSFDVQNPNDQFIFKADVGLLVADKLDSFTEPNLKINLNGEVDKTYFTISGEKTASIIDMKINYNDFSISILNKEGKEEKKVLSAIANLFIKKNSEKDGENFREGRGHVTPDNTKSFFNYLWLNIKEGLLRSITGVPDKVDRAKNKETKKAARNERRAERKKERLANRDNH
ncbi:protein of unknown function (DUF748) [Aequorivita sublithincola DSM 14238]|uniref:DUF748 domain-containing protein n=1 Tax=Aequorivita sublithincola (strain DSM 14238 / LMG 21431 / ACAM 643 / 9-3) TaxID=746697 RepID=I3YTI2_AEQSU|nr:hypothetical protein [Aequorivita sublithincola]AFL80300.1 protein of unknown function (DUF748) [Aequorivita sublithincola DSM 14238]